MKIDISNKHALVTGGSKGIGAAIANELSSAGAKVTVVARSEPESPIEGVTYLQADFSKPEEALEIIGTYVKGNPIDILVNNSGGPAPGPIAEAGWEQFLKGMEMHLRMSQGLVQLTTSHMKAQKFGRIINIISTSVKMPIPGLGVSNTVRGAIASWAKTLSFELGGSGITVNNLLPGFIQTTRLDAIVEGKSNSQSMTQDQVRDQLKSWIPAGRFGKPEEMAYMATFLASDLASYVNGVSIQIDGGRTGAL